MRLVLILFIIFSIMKKQIFILFLLFGSFSVWAQFSTQTELKYLQIINANKNKELIKNNLWNAELKADSILYNKEQTLVNQLFFIELSKSYFLLKKYDLSLLNLYKQSFLFPNDSLSIENKQLFFELMYRNNFTDSISHILWEESQKNNLSNDYNHRLNFLLKKVIDIHSKRLTPYIFDLAHLYERFSIKRPIYLSYWEFLSLIKAKERHKKQIIHYENNQNVLVYQTIKKDRLKYKIYRKAIKHYIRANALKKSKELINTYQAYDLSLILKLDLIVKKSRVTIKKLF